MTEVEKRTYKTLLLLDLIAIIIAVVAGPLDYTDISIGAAVAACIISVALIAYGLVFWVKKERR